MELENWDQGSDCRSIVWWGVGEISREAHEIMWNCPSLNDERETSGPAGIGVKNHGDGSGQGLQWTYFFN